MSERILKDNEAAISAETLKDCINILEGVESVREIISDPIIKEQFNRVNCVKQVLETYLPQNSDKAPEHKS